MSRIYIRMKKKVTMQLTETIRLNDIAYIDATEEDVGKLEAVQIHRISKKDGEFLVIEAFILLSMLQKAFPEKSLELVGPEETIITIEQEAYKPSVLMIISVWIILFIGTAMSIMNFHYDVNMPEVHEKLHYMFTGKHNSRPLWIQIPYSLGLGVGMVLFLNHWFKRRINEEPSPLEIELFKYQQDIDAYIKHYENDLNDDQRHF